MSEIKEFYEVFGANDISKLKGFKVEDMIDEVSEEDTEYISISFVGPNGEKAYLVIEDAVLFYGNELDG